MKLNIHQINSSHPQQLVSHRKIIFKTDFPFNFKGNNLLVTSTEYKTYECSSYETNMNFFNQKIHASV